MTESELEKLGVVMSTIGEDRRAQALQQCKELINALIAVYKSKSPDTHWSGMATVERRGWFGRTIQDYRHVELAGWLMPPRLTTLVIFEDGSIAIEATYTRRKIFSGELKSVEDGVFRVELEKLEMHDLLAISAILAHLALTL